MDRNAFIQKIDVLIRDTTLTEGDLISKIDQLVKEAVSSTKDDVAVLYGIISLDVLLHATKSGGDCLRRYMKESTKFEVEKCKPIGGK